MKTTELFVEQVIIGLAVLVAGGLMLPGDLAQRVFHANLGEIAVIVAAAYLVGIIYDRVGDTLLQDLERHGILLFALGRRVRAPDPNNPFPIGRLRLAVLQGPDGVATYAHYLRSRIRLMRALTTLAPLLCAAVGLGLLDRWPAKQIVGTLLVVLLYGAGFLAKLTASPGLRTEDLANDATRTDYERTIGGYDRTCGAPSLGPVAFLDRNEPLAWHALGVIAIGTVAAMIGRTFLLGLAWGAAGAIVTALAGWSWWRISRTHYDLLTEFERGV